MPVYVYRNLNTNETFEIQQRITEAALTHHPETGDPVKRLIQPVGIAFKGSGFYVTDSRSGNKSAKGSTSSEASTKTDGSTETSKTETSKTETSKDSTPKEKSSSSTSKTSS